jgi:CDP-diacylglycerol--serine O-phosphatidyltransferase
VDFRKTYYILPNLFTLSCVLSGFTSLALSAAGKGEADLYLAALAICFGFFFDTFDGRVARLTKTQTDLGRELDSLADVITFGAAPGLLVYKWGLTSFGRLGVLIAGLYVCAGALRLARFNVLSHREQMAGQKKPGKYTLGLSIPPAASVLVMMVILSHHSGDFRVISESATAAIVLVLSVLMVSRVRFRSFKDVRWNAKTAGMLLLIAGVYAAIRYAGLHRASIFLFLVTAYIALGLAEEVIFFRTRRAEARASRQAAVEATAPAEEEVLRELGAYDDTEEPPPGPHLASHQTGVAALASRHGNEAVDVTPGAGDKRLIRTPV